MAKRRVHLGSGLQKEKLAETMRDLADSTVRESLICDGLDTAEGWLHLSYIRESTITGASRWELKLGYPYHTEPLEVFMKLDIALPGDATLVAWESGLFAHFHIPAKVSAEVLSKLIIDVMIRLQGIRDTQHIRIVLE